jgi:hypothetical protein
MKHRPNDPLIESIQELKRQHQNKPPEPKVTDREFRFENGSGQNQKQIGERLCPEGHRYAATLAVHLYKKENSIDASIITQITDTSFIPEAFVQGALKELTLATMHRYGRSLPEKVTKDSPDFKDNTKTD